MKIIRVKRKELYSVTSELKWGWLAYPYVTSSSWTSYLTNKLQVGLTPQSLIFGMVRNDACIGHLENNPFNFQLFDLQGVRLTVSGEEMPCSTLDLTGGKKIDDYNTLFSGSGDMNCNHSLYIDREDLEHEYGLFRFDLTPAGSGHPDHLITHRSGKVNLYINLLLQKPEFSV